MFIFVVVVVVVPLLFTIKTHDACVCRVLTMCNVHEFGYRLLESVVDINSLITHMLLVSAFRFPSFSSSSDAVDLHHSHGINGITNIVENRIHFRRYFCMIRAVMSPFDCYICWLVIVVVVVLPRTTLSSSLSNHVHVHWCNIDRTNERTI